MDIDAAFGIHPAALSLHARRAEILAANLANADTPGYKARDLDFKAILSNTLDKDAVLPLQRTHSTHLKASIGEDSLAPKYTIPSQPSVDGNTVDGDRERAAFASNALGYQASLSFVGGRGRSLLTAIKGE
ncbi:flagellar basal-body rod protein FlgB [Gammaproteobacteria bacterium]